MKNIIAIRVPGKVKNGKIDSREEVFTIVSVLMHSPCRATNFTRTFYLLDAFPSEKSSWRNCIARESSSLVLPD